jgi:hypothetical protein
MCLVAVWREIDHHIGAATTPPRLGDRRRGLGEGRDVAASDLCRRWQQTSPKAATTLSATSSTAAGIVPLAPVDRPGSESYLNTYCPTVDTSPVKVEAARFKAELMANPEWVGLEATGPFRLLT